MRISELAAAAHETTRTLRFYETAGLLSPPPRTHSNYREYPDCAIAQVQLIRSLQTAGLALNQIAAIIHILENAPRLSATDAALLDGTLAHIDTQLDVLHRTRDDLEVLAKRAQGLAPADSNRPEPNSSNQDLHHMKAVQSCESAPSKGDQPSAIFSQP